MSGRPNHLVLKGVQKTPEHTFFLAAGVQPGDPLRLPVRCVGMPGTAGGYQAWDPRRGSDYADENHRHDAPRRV
jgi:hypothetical protein